MSQLKKDLILEFIRNNPSPSGQEIAAFAEMIGCSKSYVYYVIERNGFALFSRRDLTPRNYASAVISGITTIDALSRYFGVSQSSIRRFEKEHRVKQKLNDYYKIWKSQKITGVSSMENVITILQGFKNSMDAVSDFESEAGKNSSKILYIIQFLQDIKP